MNEKVKIKEIRKGTVECRPDEVIPLDYCRFCVHSKSFMLGGREVPSPARIYCLARKPSKEEIDFTLVEAVVCDDRRGEGYRSMMNIIG
jgi:hypothetical protein